LHYWYQYVNKAIPGTALWAVSQRVFFDEFVFTPVYLPIFMGGLWTLEGIEWKRVQDMLMNEMPNVIVAEWYVRFLNQSIDGCLFVRLFLGCVVF
jgi:hypothetical protein